jgi:cytochrome c1
MLQDGTVTFPDGAPNNLEAEAKDVATFLNWAADPHLNERHQMGIRVMIFLTVLSVLLYGVKRQIWADAH